MTVIGSFFNLFLIFCRTSKEGICMLRGLIGGHVLRAMEQSKVMVIPPSLLLNCLTRMPSAKRMLSTPVSSLMEPGWSVFVPGDQLAAVNGCLSFLLVTITKAVVPKLSFQRYNPLQTAIAVPVEMAVMISLRLSWGRTY